MRGWVTACRPDASHDAARAVALAAGDGGRHYVEALLRAVGQPDATEEEALARLVERHQTAARALLQVPGDTKALADCWKDLLEDVRAAVRPEVWERLQVLH